MTVQTPLMTYDDALRQLLQTRSTFGGGLANHGPMATEALDHMDIADWIGPFFDSYRPRLDPRTQPPERGGDWRRLATDLLPDLVGDAAAGAGHALLRTAHALRGVERAAAEGMVPAVRVDELRTSLHLWQSGNGLSAPAELTGDLAIGEWSDALAPLATFEPVDGLLTVSLAMAAEQPGYVDAVASLQRHDDVHDTLDMLAMRALEGYLANDHWLSWFTLLHGVTVSNMAHVLVDHLDHAGQRRLEAAVAGFVAAAAIAFDRRTTSPGEPPAVVPDQARRAAATLDDHTIKFTDACLSLAARTGSDLPLQAIELQIQRTT